MSHNYSNKPAPATRQSFSLCAIFARGLQCIVGRDATPLASVFIYLQETR